MSKRKNETATEHKCAKCETSFDLPGPEALKSMRYSMGCLGVHEVHKPGYPSRYFSLCPSCCYEIIATFPGVR